MKKKLLLLFVFLLSIFSVSAQKIEKTIEYENIERQYAIYKPSSAATDSITGVIICLHPFTGHYSQFYSDGEYSAVDLADKLNLLMITPQGLAEQDGSITKLIQKLKHFSPAVPSLTSVWGCGLKVSLKTEVEGGDLFLAQFGIPDTIELNKNIDDTGFIDTILEETLKEYKLGKENIFVLGISMGAYMSYQYALTHGDKLSGLISIVGSMGLAIKDKEKDVKLPICDFHSLTDEVVPYNGFQQLEIPLDTPLPIKVYLAEPKKDVIDFWVKKNGAHTDPIIENYPPANGKTVEKRSYKSDKNEVIHYQLNGSSHNYFFKKENSDCIDYYEEVAKFIAPKIKGAATNLNGMEYGMLDKTVSFYPNPAKDLIHFTTDKALVEIYSISGQKLISTNLNSTSLDISRLSKGIYIIQITTEYNKQKGKLIVR